MRRIAGLVVVYACILASCRKEKITIVPFEPGDPVFSATVDSVTYNFSTADTNFTFEATVNKTWGTPPNPNTAIYSSQVYRTIGFNPSVVVRKGRLSFYDSIPDNDDFLNFFAIGTYTYSVNAMDGFEILFVDQQGVLWNTSELLGYQGSHRFTIMTSTPFMDNGICSVKITASFSCTLYHPAYGWIELENGYYEGVFKNI